MICADNAMSREQIVSVYALIRKVLSFIYLKQSITKSRQECWWFVNKTVSSLAKKNAMSYFIFSQNLFHVNRRCSGKCGNGTWNKTM